MWCFPLAPWAKHPDADLMAWLGVEVRWGRKAKTPIVHVFTHRIWELWPWVGTARSRPRIQARTDGRVLSLAPVDALPDGGIPSVTRKLLAAIET
jgi:A/G-specific adenine glycosylase